jgi:hypothetical protein
MEKLCTGWVFRVSEFCFFFFCQVWLQQESILFGLLKVFQAHLKLAASGLAGGQWRCGGGGPPVLSVYHSMKPSTS